MEGFRGFVKAACVNGMIPWSFFAMKEDGVLAVRYKSTVVSFKFTISRPYGQKGKDG